MVDERYRDEMERIRLGDGARGRIVSAMADAQSAPRRGGRPVRPVRAALAAAAICVVLAASALALSPTLREALMAALGSFAPYSHEVDGASATDQGIEIRAVSALSDGNAAKVYFEVRDLTGDRLDAITEVDGYHVDPPEANWASCSYGVGTCLGYDAERRAALFCLNFRGSGEPAEDLTLEVGFSSILPGVQRFCVPFPAVELSGEILPSETLPTGETVLVPGQTPVELEGTELFSLSSYGFAADGKLHQLFQVNVSGVNWEETRINTFLGSAGYETEDDFARIKRYNVDGTGARETAFERDGVTYYDVCYGAEPEDAADILPRDIQGYMTTGRRIDGNWELEIALEDVPRRTIPIDVTLSGITAEKLHLTTLGCTVESDPNGRAGTVNYPLTAFFADGSTALAGGADGVFHAGGYAVNHWSFPDAVDVEQIVGVAIGLWYIPLDGGTAGPGHWLAELPE